MSDLPLSLEYSEARGYNLGIARELGLAEACVFNQLIFWQARSKGEWFYKSLDDMAEELPLSVSTIRRAYDTLKKAGYIETKLQKVNGTPILHFRICRIVKMDLLKMNKSMDSANLNKSINNKTPIKNNTKDRAESQASPAPQQVRAVYRLYLKCFKLEKGSGLILTEEEQLAMAEKRYKLTPKRRAAIERRLEDAGYNMLCAAIVGYSREPWYLGENDRGWSADLEQFICRSYEKVEEGANKYERQKQSKNTNDPWA